MPKAPAGDCRTCPLRETCTAICPALAAKLPGMDRGRMHREFATDLAEDILTTAGQGRLSQRSPGYWDRRRLFYRVKQHLTKQQRKILWRIFVAGKTERKVASELKIRRSAVHEQRVAIRRKLREYLGARAKR